MIQIQSVNLHIYAQSYCYSSVAIQIRPLCQCYANHFFSLRSAMSISASSCAALISCTTLINFFIRNNTRPTTKASQFALSSWLLRPSEALWAWMQAAIRKISLPATRVNSTFLLPQQRLSSQYLDLDSLWCEPLSKVTYIWYQCDTKSSTMSPKNTQDQSGQSPARMASITPFEARSQTMSNTAPNLVDCLKYLAAMPSKASSTWLSPQQMSAASGCVLYNGNTANRKANLRYPMMLGTKRKTMMCVYIMKGQKQGVQQQNLQAVMAELGQHFRALHFQSLADENEELRRRVAKLTEIEGYVELLVDKLEKAERREQLLSGENALLRQQARELEIKFSQNESMHGDQMRYVFAQHDQLVQEKNRALAHIKSQFDQEQSRSLHLQSQLKAQRNSTQRAVQEYESALSQLAISKKELQSDLQVLYQSQEQQKAKFYSEKEGWAAQANRIRAIIQEKSMTVNELGKQLDHMGSELDISELQNKKLSDYNKQLETSFQKRQAETQETIARLQDAINLLRAEVEKISNENLSLRAVRSSLQQQLQQMKVIQVHMRNDNETYVTDNQRLIFLLEEADKENAFIREKQREIEEYTGIEGENARSENLKLREEIGVLTRNNSERENYLSTKLMELKDLLNAKNTLELQLGQCQSQLCLISEELALVSEARINEKARSTELQLALKNALEESTKAKQSLLTAQQVSQRIQQQNLQLSSQNHALCRQLSNPRELSKDYRDQVQKMLKNFHEQREEQAKRHWLQKQKLREVYEYQLKEKQLQFARKVAQLEEELLRGKRLEAMSARMGSGKGK